MKIVRLTCLPYGEGGKCLLDLRLPDGGADNVCRTSAYLMEGAENVCWTPAYLMQRCGTPAMSFSSLFAVSGGFGFVACPELSSEKRKHERKNEKMKKFTHLEEKKSV